MPTRRSTWKHQKQSLLSKGNPSCGSQVLGECRFRLSPSVATSSPTPLASQMPCGRGRLLLSKPRPSETFGQVPCAPLSPSPKMPKLTGQQSHHQMPRIFESRLVGPSRHRVAKTTYLTTHGTPLRVRRRFRTCFCLSTAGELISTERNDSVNCFLPKGDKDSDRHGLINCKRWELPKRPD